MRIPSRIIAFMLAAALPLSAEEPRPITGYGPFDFARTVTPGEVENAGGSRLSPIEKGQSYAFRPYERFEGLADFLRYHREGKVPPARQSGSVPKITATEVRLENSKLWLIILNFSPRDYDEYLRIIKLEHGAPASSSQKGTGDMRKDVWLSGRNCIVLQVVDKDNPLSGGQLEIKKDRCEQVR